MSFKELKGNKSVLHILQNNTSLLSFKCLQSWIVQPLHLTWIRKWQIPHLTASSQLAVVGYKPLYSYTLLNPLQRGISQGRASKRQFMLIKMIQPWSSSWYIMQILQRKQSVKFECMSTQKRLKATSSAQFTSHCTIMIFQARLNFNLRCHSFLYQHTCQMKVKASWHQFLACYLHCQSDVKCSALHTDIINHVDGPCGYRLSPSI